MIVDLENAYVLFVNKDGSAMYAPAYDIQLATSIDTFIDFRASLGRIDTVKIPTKTIDLEEIIEFMKDAGVISGQSN